MVIPMTELEESQVRDCLARFRMTTHTLVLKSLEEGVDCKALHPILRILQRKTEDELVAVLGTDRVKALHGALEARVLPRLREVASTPEEAAE